MRGLCASSGKDSQGGVEPSLLGLEVLVDEDVKCGPASTGVGSAWTDRPMRNRPRPLSEKEPGTPRPSCPLPDPLDEPSCPLPEPESSPSSPSPGVVVVVVVFTSVEVELSALDPEPEPFIKSASAAPDDASETIRMSEPLTGRVSRR